MAKLPLLGSNNSTGPLMVTSRFSATSPMQQHHRRKLTPAPPPSSSMNFRVLIRTPLYAGIATAVTVLVALALTADLFLLQAYNRVLTEQEGNRNIPQPPSRSLRLASTDVYADVPYGNLPWPVKSEPEGLKIAWLMSFPNSGTSFTSRLVRDATKTDSASNYADETPTGEAGLRVPVFEDQPTGPFWIKPEANPEFTEPTEYVITKTHCGIRCTMCPPEKYAESSYSFRRNCLKTKWMDVDEEAGTKERIFSQYQPDRLTKAVHLIRDPFDNIVSRYHLERQLPGRTAGDYPKTREGFRSYCKAIDSLHKVNEKRTLFLDDDLLEIMKVVPCHADFFRYIEWHNLAFITTRDLDLDTYVLQYDWYETRFNETATELLDFLHLPIHETGELTPFVPGKIYPYFTDEEKLAVHKAFEMMASPVTWKYVQSYFDEVGSSLEAVSTNNVDEIGISSEAASTNNFNEIGSSSEAASADNFDEIGSSSEAASADNFDEIGSSSEAASADNFDEIGSSSEVASTDSRLEQQKGESKSTAVSLQTQEHSRPTLSSLVEEGSETKITGDVQFLMDFAIVGYPKTATSTKVRWLAQQTEIQMYDHEVYHLKDGQPASMVRKLYELPEGDEYMRGYKAPRDIHNPRAIDSFAKYWPKTKLIVGLRHPVLWFESFYNYRVRNNIVLPPPRELIGNCPPGAHNVCTEEIRYNDHLSILGKTDRTDPEELKLLSPIKNQHRKRPKLENPVFLYEISQMHDTDLARTAQYRDDLQEYLGLQQTLDPLTEEKESHGDHTNKAKEIDICSQEHVVLHAELMQIAQDSSLWIRNYFLHLPDVFVSSPDYFNNLLEGWMIDPCVARGKRNKAPQLRPQEAGLFADA